MGQNNEINANEIKTEHNWIENYFRQLNENTSFIIFFAL